MNLSRNWRIVFTLATGGLLSLVMIALAIQPGRAAGPWYVTPGGDDGNACTSPAAPCATINGAITKASSGDTIFAAAATYIGTGDEVVLIYRDITLSGGWDVTFTTQNGTSTIDGEESRRGMTVNSNVTAIVEHFTLQNGFAASGSGGIEILGGALTLTNSTVSGNTGDVGGGIHNTDGTLILNNSMVVGNEARHGGGIQTYNYYDGNVILNNSTISGNAASNRGGGIYNQSGHMILNNSAVSDNTAADGGGIYNYWWAGTLDLNNSTISRNTASSGGGVFNYDASLTLNSSTVSDNTASEGGGIANADFGTGDVTLQNTVLAGNTADGAPDCSGDIGSSGYNLVGDTSDCTFSADIGDLTDVDAILGQLIGASGVPRYHPLLEGSPAVDAGNPAGCTGSTGPLTTDQRGATRVGRCDIGAYEYTIPGPAVSIWALEGTPQHTTPSSAFRLPLQAAVLDYLGSPVGAVSVTFSAPASGPSGLFSDSGDFTTTAVTGESGVATAAPFIANELAGSYSVTATVSGVVTPANFLLSNLVWHVAPGGDDVNDCQTPATPCATINGVIAKTDFVAGDSVRVATGTYTGTGDEVVLLDEDATLSGGWDETFTVQSGSSTIDGEGSRRGITVNTDVIAILERFVVRNGYADQGAGIFSEGTLALSTSTVWANAGTGIRNWHGTVTLDNSDVSSNLGDGIVSYGTMTLNSSAVSGNSGEGIVNGYGCSLLLNSSIVNGNNGSGIGNGGTLVLNNSTVSGNAADYGGGIFNEDGTLTLNNCTVSGNTASHGGGGIYNGYGTTALRNTILAGNTSASRPDCWGTIGSLGYNLVGDTSGCDFGPTTGDMPDTDPKLGRLVGIPAYHPLIVGSPAIDAGNPAGCTDELGNPLDTDQRGADRVGRCDIGAYEYTLPGPATSISAIGGTPQRTPPLSTFEMPLQAAVLDNIGTPVNDVTVTFSAPASGASGTFADSGTFTTARVTDDDGVTVATAFTANGLAGSYSVIATVSGVLTPTNFLLSNFGWYVTPAGDDSSDCQTPMTPCATINGVLGKAGFAAGDTILVGSGTYTGTGDEVVLLDKNVRVLGGWEWDGILAIQSGNSIIDGEGARRGITVNDDVIVTAERVDVQNGSSVGGGGIYNAGGTLTLTDCSVSNSTGGGITDFGTLTLDNCSVSDNAGGGIYNGQGSTTLKNSAVEGNSTSGDGGGICNNGSMTLNNSAVCGNSASNGGGIRSYGTLHLNNSTVSGNAASNRGAGIYNMSGHMTLNSSTISGNTGDWGSGGIYNEVAGTLTLQNTILAGNTASWSGPDCHGTVGSSGYNLIGDTSGCTFSPSTGDLIDIDAGLFPLVGSPGYHPLSWTSPAINGGNPAGCTDHLSSLLLTDQRGKPRVGRCDIGAYEVMPLYFSSKIACDSAALHGEPLTYTISVSNIETVKVSNVSVADPLPISLTYLVDSVTADSGSYGYSGGVITWTGSVNAGDVVYISFGATVSEAIPTGTVITNSVVISGGWEIITRTTALYVATPIYLPIVMKGGR